MFEDIGYSAEYFTDATNRIVDSVLQLLPLWGRWMNESNGLDECLNANSSDRANTF